MKFNEKVLREVIAGCEGPFLDLKPSFTDPVADVRQGKSIIAIHRKSCTHQARHLFDQNHHHQRPLRTYQPHGRIPQFKEECRGRGPRCGLRISHHSTTCHVRNQLACSQSRHVPRSGGNGHVHNGAKTQHGDPMHRRVRPRCVRRRGLRVSRPIPPPGGSRGVRDLHDRRNSEIVVLGCLTEDHGKLPFRRRGC